ncbi:hypothetical protein [Ruminococcus flavefaciens]|uniref:hypothetical protein n=1 Tax=Ruminococcus flavefaciens TaxID=1265 RepID=UPI00048A9CC4|nr:hypothetical protein [Ruminococcus flavefaciens]
MKSKLKRCITATAAFAALASLGAVSAAAGEPYDSYNYDRWGEAVPSQAGFTAECSVSGYDLGVGAFDSPSDIFCDHEHIFYIADTGNNRIVAVNSDFESVVKVYDSFTMPDGSETPMNKPMGVYVSAENDLMYIADSDNARVLISDKDGNVQGMITKPDSEVYDRKRTFLPQRVIADKAGNVYVVLSNITTGAAMFAPDGSFMGFYGANRVEPTAKIVSNYIRSIFMSDEKKANRKRTVPTGITSFDIDGDFIFTCTSSSTQTTDTVKKLNAAGKNIFADLELSFGDYKPVYDTSQNKVLSPAIVDIDVAEDGCINCLDLTTGRVFQYDEDCNLLFITGAAAKQTGGFDHAAAIESLDNDLYVLDSSKDTVTIFRETSFGKAVHKAAALYNAGYYEEALEPWQDVLKRDGNYYRAYVGIASALLRKGDYKGAMKYAKLSDAGDIYNKAFEGYRREFLREHFTAIAAGLVILIAGSVTYGKFRKKRRASTAADNISEKEEKQA